MNYRHAYHAGNHGDVLKHIVLARLIEHLKKKDKGFSFLDAHAGIGLYDLAGVEAFKTGEWQEGLGKMAEPFAADVEALLKPWRDVISGVNPRGGLRLYPGSPEIALRLLRGQDRVVLNELHPDDHRSVAQRYAGDERVRVIGLDAESAVKAHLPPPERRGLVLIDPPYEEKNEARRAASMVFHGLERFANGVFVLWYPIKADRIDKDITREVKRFGVAGTLKVEVRVREAFEGGGLAGSGLIIINTPWQADKDFRKILPPVAKRLGLGGWGHATVEWLVPPI